MFNIFRHKKNDKENTQMATIDEVKKAYEELSEEDKEAFKQGIVDRVDESVAMSEKESGEENTQTAKDRIDEAVATEMADETTPSETPAVSEATPQQAPIDYGEDIEILKSEIAELKSTIEALKKQPEKVEPEVESDLDKLYKKFNG